MILHEIKIEGKKRIHAQSPIAGYEFTLCGISASLDSSYEIEHIRDINISKGALKKINCEECLKIINFCNDLQKPICPECNGTGRVRGEKIKKTTNYRIKETWSKACPPCNGTGWLG